MIEILRSLPDLRAAYPFIEEGVEAIRGKAPDLAEIAPDVYAAVMSKAVTLAMISDGDKLCGWTCFYQDRGFDGGTTIVSWMTYLRPGSSPRCLEELIDWTEGLAVETNSDKIQFTTSRPAWGRRLAHRGYRVTSVNVEKEVGSDG